MLMVGLVLDLLAPRERRPGSGPGSAGVVETQPDKTCMAGWPLEILADHPSLAAAMRSDVEGSRIDALLDAGCPAHSRRAG